MRERGDGKLHLFVALLVTAAVIVGALRLIPVYVRAYEFRDTMRNQAKFAGVGGKAPEAIRDELLKKARELELPIQRDQIRVTPSAGGAGVKITARFAVPVNLVVYTRDFPFDFEEDTRYAY